MLYFTKYSTHFISGNILKLLNNFETIFLKFLFIIMTMIIIILIVIL